MIKLISQFDNEKTRLSLATPTCGGCCCCSCCLVSTTAASCIGARSFGDYVAEKLPNEPEKAKKAMDFGFWLPIGLIISLIVGMFVAAMYKLSIFVALIIGIAYLSITTYSLKIKIGLSGITLKVIVFLILSVIIETIGLFLGMYAFLGFGFGYLIVAIIISILLIGKNYNYDNLENVKSDNNLENVKSDDNFSNLNISNNQSNENINNNIEILENTDGETKELVQEESRSKVEIKKKKCPKCGTENAMDNKSCFYCSNYFDTDDEK